MEKNKSELSEQNTKKEETEEKEEKITVTPTHIYYMIFLSTCLTLGAIIAIFILFSPEQEVEETDPIKPEL